MNLSFGREKPDGKPRGLFRNLAPKIAAIPMIFTVVVVFLGCTAWTIYYSMTNSRVLPGNTFVGLAQYRRLFASERWQISIENLFVFGTLALVFSLAAGFLLAALMDQKIRFENTFRTILLYPFALSMVITGLVWAWIMNPTLGLQKSVRAMGWTDFQFDWITDRQMVIYALVIAAVWQITGLVMALMLAGMRGVDSEIWKASRIDGIPTWRTYVSIVLPMMRPVFVTAFVIVSTGLVATFDLVFVMTGGGPGLSSQFPSLYVYEFIFQSNLGQGLAAASVMFLTAAIIIIPWAYYEFRPNRR